MLSDYPFYHETVRKLVIAFGTIFSGLTIVKNDTSGNKKQVIKVPLAYGPRDKWLENIKADADKSKNIELYLPRLAFEVIDYRYDPNRKIGAQGSYVLGTGKDGKPTRFYNPVPYDITIQLHSICKNQEDSLQILEQILPYFAPQVSVEISITDEFEDLKKTVPIILQQVQVQDDYEGPMNQYRTVIQTFTFVAQADFFGPSVNSELIKTSIANVSMNPTNKIDSSYTADVTPKTANETDPHTVTETWGFQ